MISVIVLSSLLGIATAQTTLNAPLIGFDAMTVAASVVSAGPDATTLALGCIATTEDCGLFPKDILVFGPSTYNIDMSDPNTDFTATVDCMVAASSAVCKETAGGSEANFPGSSTTTYDMVGTWEIQITAGEEKLSATSKPASGVAAATSSSAGGVLASITPSARSGSASVIPSVSRTSSATAQASTGAAGSNAAALTEGLLGAAAGVFGGLLL